jgi:large subunit ribosomal protein L32
MSVPRRRHCQSRRDKARTHKKIASKQLVKCPNEKCGAMKLAHRVCPVCGTYQGREYKTVVTAS